VKKVNQCTDFLQAWCSWLLRRTY